LVFMAKKSKRLNQRSFEKLFKELFTPLVYHAYKVIKDYDIAKDIVHEAFIKLWNNRSNIEVDRNVKAYLYRTVYNLSLNYIRDNKKMSSTEDLLEADINPVEFDYRVEAVELQEAIFKAIQSMPEKMRQAFLYKYQGLKYKEIAEKMNISVKTVEVHISKAMKILREKLSDFHDSE